MDLLDLLIVVGGTLAVMAAAWTVLMLCSVDEKPALVMVACIALASAGHQYIKYQNQLAKEKVLQEDEARHIETERYIAENKKRDEQKRAEEERQKRISREPVTHRYDSSGNIVFAPLFRDVKCPRTPVRAIVDGFDICICLEEDSARVKCPDEK